MAFCYEKKDPGSGTWRWYAKVKIASKHVPVSLHLLAPENKRLARDRANRLQAECDLGTISPATREWLGERAAQRLAGLVRPGGKAPTAPGKLDWQDAKDRYLAAMAPQDTRGHVKGKAVADEEHTKFNRTNTLKLFIQWANAEHLRFNASGMSDALGRYLVHRLDTVSPNTVRNSDFPYLAHWSDWLARNGLATPIDRKAILEQIPPRITPETILPPWETDLKAIRYFHARRDAPIAGSTWRIQRGLHAAWGLILLVRGLGCRPSEAISLDWSTVDLDTGRIRFLRSKTGGHRVVPILYAWVADGLAELAERNGTVGAVCLSAVGTPYPRETIAAGLIRRTCQAANPKLPVYHLKVAQKLWIRQTIVAGFPPHVVALWADHSLSMQERHYAGAAGYLPPDETENYAEFAALTELGQKTRAHLTMFAREFGE